MKLKMFVVLSAVAVAGFVIGSTLGCHSSKEPALGSGQTVAYYTCPMHPAVKSDKPGSCSICGMALVPAYTNTPAAKP